MNKIDADIIKRSRLFSDLFFFKTLDSTNTKARQLYGKKKNSFIVLADKQTKGRGRFDRKWFSPAEENLYLTLCLPGPSLDYNHAVMVTSLAVLETIKTYYKKAGIKWPNDILADQKKISGILIESEYKKDRLEVMFIGIGINLHTDFSRVKELSGLAISLEQCSKKKISGKKILEELVRRFENYYLDFPALRKKIIRDWKKQIMYKDKIINFKLDGEIIAGLLQEVYDDGSILLSSSDGEKVYSFGEII